MTEMVRGLILDLLNEGVEVLEEAGIANARVEAELLLAEALGGCERVELYTGDLGISVGNRAEFERMIEKRHARYPLQYILGWAEFFGMRFKVTPDVLIPRPETEILVETVLRTTHDARRTTILDIGTGSGNIVAALAKALPNAEIYAIDISEEALNIARANAQLNKVRERIVFLQEDVFKPSPEPRIPNSDIIVSNPPYIPKRTLEDLPREVGYEPAFALDGGEDGLDYYRKLIPSARKHLKDGGRVFFEVGDGQAGAVRDLFEESGYGEIEIFKDLNGIERVVSARS